MKLSEKAIVIGVVTFFIFSISTFMIGGIIDVIVPGGDEFINSYYMPLYAGVVSIGAIVVSCTYILVKKIDILLNEMKK